MRLQENRSGLCIQVFLSLGLIFPCFAQELEPRRWSHLPMGTNFAGGGYAYTEADIAFDPALRLENVEMKMDTWAFKFIHTLELFEKSARIDFAQAYQEGRWAGLVNGVPSSIKRRGLSDSVVRFAINLCGSPPLKGKEYAAYRATLEEETIVGMALAVHLPTGDYMNDKLINLGSNRFTFRPQLGVVHTRGKWSMEVTGSAWIYTDNDEFYNGNTLEQDPLYTAQAHLIHTFKPGVWTGASVGYGHGAESKVSGIDMNDRKGNLMWGVSFGRPLSRHLGVQVAYVGTRAQEPTGFDSDSIVVGFSAFW
jgi:hypothetical protein